MAIFRWSPKNINFGSPSMEIERMKNHMETMYGALSRGLSQIKQDYTSVFPLVNLTEDDLNLYLTAELPGVDPQSLDVTVKGDTLSLKGQLAVAEPSEDVSFHRRERQAGGFRRSLVLPVKIEAEKVEAKVKNGVLTLVLPKANEARAHQVVVKAE